ncbi:MAG TPA: hypothetical protein VF587_06615 [Solirubrobacteraceae bacterium]|jgi:hypothetical protein
MSASTSRPDPVAPLVQRLVAASGILFVILTVAAFVLSGDETPSDGAPLTEWTSFAVDNEDNARIGALVFALAIYNFLLFLGYVRAAVGNAEVAARGFTRGSYIVLAAGTVGIAGMGLGIGLTASSLANPDTPPETIRALYDVSSGAWLLASAGFGACLVTVGLINAGVRALPAWLGWVALGSGISFVLQLGVLLSEDEDNAFGFFFPIAFLLLAIFCVGASVVFLKDLSRDAVGRATPGPD